MNYRIFTDQFFFKFLFSGKQLVLVNIFIIQEQKLNE